MTGAAETHGEGGRLTPGAVAAVLAGLTLAGFLLRLRAAGSSLASDEIFLYSIVHDHGLGKALDLVHDTESTPPLHFVLAWGSDRIGGSETWIRLPSVVLGTATVPLVYLLGLRTVGRLAGLVAAALVALSPFAVLYGSEGRAYATLGFISVLSTLALLEAVRTRRVGWWVAFALACTAALYTHYTAIFVVAVQIVWALAAAPARWRAVALSTAAIVLLYVPWIPSFLVQRQDNAEQRIEAFHASTGNALMRTFPGQPFVSVDDLPGHLWMALLGASLAIAALSLLWRVFSRQSRPRPPRELVLIGVVALAAPLGAWLYTLGPTSIFLSRNLISSFPAFCLLIGALLMSVRPAPLRTGLMAVTVLVVAVGSAKALGERFQRPAFRDLANYLNETVPPGQPIMASLDELDIQAMRIYLDSRHRIVPAAAQDEAAWRLASRGRSVFLVRSEGGLFFGLPRLAGPGSRFVLRESRRFPSGLPLLVGRYRGRLRASIEEAGGGSVIRWSLGRPLTVSDDAARGVIDQVATTGNETTIVGWATDPAARRQANWVLVFLGDRLLAVTTPHQIRPDLAEAYGPGVVSAGFNVVVAANRAESRRLRVFAVWGNGAKELRPSS